MSGQGLNVENRYIVRTGRVDLRPGDAFTHFGQEYKALTYPHGAVQEVFPGLFVDRGPVFDPEHYTPKVGEIVAELLE